jgi:hypothetical protein
VTNEATQEARRATATASGAFRVSGLTSRRYAVVLRAPGYRPATDAVQNANGVSSDDFLGGRHRTLRPAAGRRSWYRTVDPPRGTT